MTTVIEVIAALTMLAGITGIMAHRVKTRKGIGVRVIQAAGIVIGLPIILILALENKLDSASSALLGTVFGYLLSNISNFDKIEG